MARPKKSDVIDLAQAHDLTDGLIERLTCPADKQQAFMRDSDTKGLRVRVTAAGAKSFVFEAKLNRQTIRRTIGDVSNWDITAARIEARRLAVMLDTGTDPRELERQQQAAQTASKAAAAVEAVTVGEVWKIYMADRKPHWGDRHYLDHTRKAAPGGVPSKRRGYTDKVTAPGPLASLMPLALKDLTAPVVEAWAATEAKTRPTSARLAWRMLKVFLGWCEEQPAYASLMPPKNQAKTKKSREALGKAAVKSDVLQKGQLPAWFAAVQQLQNPVIAAALQTMLLTGARPGEVMALKWADVNTRWEGIQIRDKIEGTREIPLTPYVWHLLAPLTRRNEWIFSSPKGRDGRLTDPNNAHTRACKTAGLDGLTLHGLRRSFKSLTEWQERPAGVVAQIMGHKPSATAEKHYTVRPLELLALHHERIEAWILEQAGVQFDAKAEPGKLRVVAGGAV